MGTKCCVGNRGHYESVLEDESLLIHDGKLHSRHKLFSISLHPLLPIILNSNVHSVTIMEPVKVEVIGQRALNQSCV